MTSKEFIDILFGELVLNKINYGILRNAEEIARGDAHDVDLCVDTEDLVAFDTVLNTVAAKYGWKMHLKTGNKKDKENIRTYHFYYSDSVNKVIYIAHIDVFPNFSWRNYVLIENEVLLNSISTDTVYHKIAEETEAVINLFIRLLYNGRIKEKYKPSIKLIFGKSKESVCSVMAAFISIDLAEKIYCYVIDEKWSVIEECRDEIIKQICKKCRCIKGPRMKYLFEKFVSRPGIMIAFEGTDGSGKSTIINNLPKFIDNTFPQNMVSCYHWRPEIIKKGRSNGNTPVTEPHEKKPYGKVLSFAKFMLFNIDYVLGYYLRARIQLAKGHLVIFDRYYYDYYLDKVRYRLTISDGMLDFWKTIIPKPDITFLLAGDPQVLYNRKKELPIEEVEKQVNKLLIYKDRFSNPIVIDVNQDIDLVTYCVSDAILQFCNERYKEGNL